MGRAMQLAESLQPRNFGNQQWFKSASLILESYQTEERLKEEKAWQQKRQPFLDELKKELDTIKEKSIESAQDFMVFLYKTHPPKHVRNFKVDLKAIEKCEHDVCKKFLAKCIVHYHPDKIDSGVHTM